MVQRGAGPLSPESEWAGLAEWWLEELASDPAYQEEVLPLGLELLDPRPGQVYLDLGCGEGRAMAALAERGCRAIGVDVSAGLLERAARFGEVHQAEVPPLSFLEDEVVDGVLIVLVLEHLRDERTVFEESARVTRRGGVLALVMNHPYWTSPGSTPIVDQDGEILWRPGEYFGRGQTDEPAGAGTVRFHHRSMADLLSGAGRAGWRLERMVEQGVSPAQKERFPALVGQDHLPRLLGVRWVRD